ncbi:MAG: cupin domain-containing protein [Alphaproteobacteria bacterium]
MILNEFPQVSEFYKTYWNKKPFIVRKAIDEDVFDNLIDGNSLAGLALEEDIKSRLVITESDHNKWTCHHGPFEEEKFSTLGNKNWSLLVQNVDQYHTDTAQLLKSFNFSPRWLMDDIMVSYSAVGGSVGPHTDSYHVFLVQGMGRRKWKVSNNIIENREYIDSADLLVLKDGFEGEEIEVSKGDVIYIPPHFGHQGVTTQEAMTFSVGFLGPKLSEMLAEYSHYLEQNEHLNKRFSGNDLNANSGKFSIDESAINIIQNDLTTTINEEKFANWVAEYFSISTHEEPEGLKVEEDYLSNDELLNFLQNGELLYRSEHIKIATTKSVDGTINLGVYGSSIVIPQRYECIIQWLNTDHKISINDLNDKELMIIITELYNKGVLSFEVQ